MSLRMPSDSLFSAEALPQRTAPDFTLESGLMRDGFRHVAGLDEAGRGPLAGPVVAAAVILDCERVPDGLNDSKLLTRDRREALFETILASAIVSVASVSAAEIDRTDIRKASLMAMVRAVAALPNEIHFALVDGRDVPPGIGCAAKAVVKGDGRSCSIAAASIVAKVMRDRMMVRAGGLFPDYGFERHMGYASAFHRAAIASKGPCALHRMSFRPLRPD
ncbi:ribonuclease HII [Pseudohoeflea coraliihabitans]|uniref:Ribonuclease HII n=1 Tax=Pseudohoeflea coraliihabitans TaxID=2860393 RepID=A0ABS6WM17_9HYPH|nr:ribonuclease HII [Pseudohoeflea sp. DP4N28-3]MBW3096977.1 ribonuclease HII [Pseudohoeflea sp. DP4N28-3]